MDKIKAFLSDKKNTPIVGAIAGIILVLVILFYLKQFGIIGGSSGQEYPSDTSMSQTPGTTPTETPPGMAPVETPVPGSASTIPGTTAAATPAAPATALDKIPPMLAYRKDPFMGYSGVPTKQDALMAILPGISHVRLAPARLTVDQTSDATVGEVLPPQPMRRVAGIMWGTTVKAILESGGKTHIVSPGTTIPEERVRVESIEPSGLILTTLDTKRPMHIRVNLAGSPAAQDESNVGNVGNESPPTQAGPRPRPGQSGGGPPVEAPPPGF